jgi:hypothetical protein
MRHAGQPTNNTASSSDMAASGHCHNPSSRQGPPLSANGKSATRTSQSSNQWLETSAATTRAARSDRVRHHHNAPPVAAQSIAANERHIKLTARPKSGCALIGKGNAFRQVPPRHNSCRLYRTKNPGGGADATDQVSA